MFKKDKIGERIGIIRQKLGDKTVSFLEKGALPGDERLLSNGIISKWVNKDVDWMSNDLDKFLNHWGIDRNWWKTGEGEPFITSAMKSTDNKQNEPEEIYRNLVEGNTEYILIPRSVLQEKYRLVSLEEFADRAKQSEKDREQMLKDRVFMEALLEQNKLLQNKLADLLVSPSSSMAAKGLKTNKA
jgi:hypothetical protein